MTFLLPRLIPLIFADLHRWRGGGPFQPPSSLGFWCKSRRGSVEHSALAAYTPKCGCFVRRLWCHELTTKAAEEVQRDANRQKSLSCPRAPEILVPLSLLAVKLKTPIAEKSRFYGKGMCQNSQDFGVCLFSSKSICSWCHIQCFPGFMMPTSDITSVVV